MKEKSKSEVSIIGGADAHTLTGVFGLPVKDTGLVLPCGASGRWER